MKLAGQRSGVEGDGAGESAKEEEAEGGKSESATSPTSTLLLLLLLLPIAGGAMALARAEERGGSADEEGSEGEEAAAAAAAARFVVGLRKKESVKDERVGVSFGGDRKLVEPQFSACRRRRDPSSSLHGGETTGVGRRVENDTRRGESIRRR